MPQPSDVKSNKGVLRHSLDQLLLIDAVRYVVAALRYLWFVIVRRRLRTWDLEKGIAAGVAENTIHHNLRGIRDLAVARSHLLVRPLSVIEAVTAQAEVLSIGPRSEGELLNLTAHGFEWSRIRGLDLISYSPRIELGDMHQMPFQDASFDVVIAGWVLAYSERPTVAANEIVRVTRPGGLVAVAVEYSPLSEEEVVKLMGYRPGAAGRIASCEEILSFFGDAVDRIYVYHDISPTNRQRIGSMCVIFSVKPPVGVPA
jgi:SAM-dependent methyltransferase